MQCWNQRNGTKEPAIKYVTSKDLCLCEGCGEWKKVIIMERKYYYLEKYRILLFPFKVIYYVLFFLWRTLLLPYTYYQYKKAEKRRQALQDVLKHDAMIKKQ